jgi:hypothetical protein
MDIAIRIIAILLYALIGYGTYRCEIYRLRTMGSMQWARERMDEEQIHFAIALGLLWPIGIFFTVIAYLWQRYEKSATRKRGSFIKRQVAYIKHEDD